MAVREAWRRFWQPIFHRLPKRLYARSLIIVIAPMLILQSVIALVFMERHWTRVTEMLSDRVSQEIAAIIDLIEAEPGIADMDRIAQIARERFDLQVELLPATPLPNTTSRPFFSLLDTVLTEQIDDNIGLPFWIDTVGQSRFVEIRIALDDAVLRVVTNRNQAYANNSEIFIFWMVGASLVLIAVAVIFLRQQIRPIQQLAAAAESFGKGQPMPAEFRPRGAEEVRRASLAFIQMRNRIERQIEQRTAMLAGVSHDLRTILTRFKLQLALAAEETDTDALERDVADMQTMLEAYLDFARGDSEEAVAPFDLATFFQTMADEARLKGREAVWHIEGDPELIVRPIAFGRMLHNIVANAMRHAERIALSATHTDKTITICIDDDGPGVPKEQYDVIFRPFTRLDDARNLDQSGTGLGLSIARDIARSHGGDIHLDKSRMGGLEVTIRLPL
ncbi:two-component sensor histidine kinase [Notoacmeibacter marinus]|uniref:histidine kinase n=1 Tax=Notoacmeibacter marinus TaxID=1876515 RepID=A0A231UY85_9HYPH|nr:two-component sensor histidine kinase [Notoacmeibacter marinus]